MNYIKNLLFIIGISILFFSVCNSTKAATTIPKTMNYQGRLLDSNTGNPITTGMDIRFSLWSSADFNQGTEIDGSGSIVTGAPNYAGWQEVQSFVPDASGLFTLQIGASTPLPDLNFNTHKFIQIELKMTGEANTSFELLDPLPNDATKDRKPLNSSPYNFNSDRLDNLDVGTGSGNIVKLNQNSQWDPTFIPGATNEDTFILDNNNSSAAFIRLQFGQALNKALYYDLANTEFVFNDNVHLQQNLMVDGTLTATGNTILGSSSGDTLTVNAKLNSSLDFNQNQAKGLVLETGTSFPATPVAGQKIFRTDSLQEYVYDGTQWLSTSTGGDAGTLDGVDSTQFLRSDTSDTFTNGTLSFGTGTTLDIDDNTVNLDEITNNNLVLDSDNTGGNVSLQFGNALNETLTWNDGNARFEISDSLYVTNDLHATGTLSNSGNVRFGTSSGDTIEMFGSFANTIHFNQQQAENFVLEKGTAFPAGPVAGQKFFRTDLSEEYVYSGTSWVTYKTVGSSSAQSVFLSPEYDGYSTMPDGTNNTGTMYLENEGSGGANSHNFFRWETNKVQANDYDILLKYYLPANFQSWNATPIQFSYKTTNAASASNKLDISLFDSLGNPIALNNATNLANTSWTQANMTISGGGYTFTPNTPIFIGIKLTSTQGNSAYSSDIRLNMNTTN